MGKMMRKKSTVRDDGRWPAEGRKSPCQALLGVILGAGVLLLGTALGLPGCKRNVDTCSQDSDCRNLEPSAICLQESRRCLIPATNADCSQQGEKRCKDIEVIEICHNGAWAFYSDCPDTQICEDGVCIPTQCRDGAERCNATSNSVEECANNQWRIQIACAAQESCFEEKCQPTGGCLDGEKRCNAQVLETCLSGTWGKSDDCATHNQSCLLKACAGECSSDAKRCSENLAQQCESGNWVTKTDCAAKTQTCYDSNCTGNCVKNELQCSPDGKQLLQCNEKGQWQSTQTCAFECKDKRCQGGTAQPGAFCQKDADCSALGPHCEVPNSGTNAGYCTLICAIDSECSALLPDGFCAAGSDGKTYCKPYKSSFGRCQGVWESGTVNGGFGNCAGNNLCVGLPASLENGYCTQHGDCQNEFPDMFKDVFDCLEDKFTCGVSFCAPTCQSDSCVPGFTKSYTTDNTCLCLRGALEFPKPPRTSREWCDDSALRCQTSLTCLKWQLTYTSGLCTSSCQADSDCQALPKSPKCVATDLGPKYCMWPCSADPDCSYGESCNPLASGQKACFSGS